MSSLTEEQTMWLKSAPVFPEILKLPAASGGVLDMVSGDASVAPNHLLRQPIATDASQSPVLQKPAVHMITVPESFSAGAATTIIGTTQILYKTLYPVFVRHMSKSTQNNLTL